MDQTTNAAKATTLSATSNEEIERIRQRLDGLRQHHKESAAIYGRTQPALDEQVHEETLKYLKNNQINGTKVKNPKARTTKRQRATSNTQAPTIVKSDPSATTTDSDSCSASLTNQEFMHRVLPLPNHHPTQKSNGFELITHPPTHSNLSQHHVLPNQQQSHIIQISNHNYSSQQQPSQPDLVHQHHMQQQSNHVQYQPIYQYQPVTQQHHQPQHIHYQTHMYQQQSQHIQQTQMNLNHYSHHDSSRYHINSMQRHDNFLDHHNLPNDLDLNIQGGLECDVDTVIKQEMSYHGQLEFNRDLLLKLDETQH